MNRAIIDKALDTLYLADTCGATELLLVRHAEPARDAECAGGGLSALGIGQTRRLAEEMQTLGLRAVYSAGTAVAAGTALTIAGECGVESEIVEQLAPIWADESGGQAMPWAAADFGTAVQMAAHQFCCYPRWDSLPGLETGRLFRRRAIGAIEAIAARHPGETVAIVTHSCVINAYLSMVLDIPRDFFFVPSHASVSSVRIKGDRYGLQYINSVHPLGRQGRGEGFNGAFMALNNPLTGRSYRDA